MEQQWERQEIIFQDPNEEQVNKKIADLEIEGWQLVERIPGRWDLGTEVIPMLRCLFTRPIQNEDIGTGVSG